MQNGAARKECDGSRPSRNSGAGSVADMASRIEPSLDFVGRAQEPGTSFSRA